MHLGSSDVLHVRQEDSTLVPARDLAVAMAAVSGNVVLGMLSGLIETRLGRLA